MKRRGITTVNSPGVNEAYGVRSETHIDSKGVVFNTQMLYTEIQPQLKDNCELSLVDNNSYGVKLTPHSWKKPQHPEFNTFKFAV